MQANAEQHILKDLGDEPVPEPEYTNLLYFSDDRKDKELKEQSMKACQYYPHQTGINLYYFLEAFILHLLHMTILGPWTFAVGVFYWPYLTLMGNMEFISFSWSFVVSMVIWFTNIMVFLCYWYYRFDSFNVGFLSLALIAIVSRAVNISAKYATFSALYRRRLMNYDLSSKERARYQLLGGWSNQDLTFAEDEILNSMMRRNIDDSTFKLSFIIEPSEKVIEMLNDVRALNQQSGETNAEAPFASSTYYDCKSLLFGLIKHHQRREQGDWQYMLAIIAGLLWGLSPGVGRSIRNQFFYGEDEIEILVWLGGMIVYSMIMIIICVMFVTAYLDLDRVVDLKEQLSQMYTPEKMLEIEDKVFPTINLADAVSLQGWMSMRRVLVTYGSRYLNRHKIFSIMLLSIFAVCSAGIFTFETFGIEISDRERTVAQTVFYFTAILYGFMFLALLRQQQMINDQSMKHIMILQENQQVFQTFHHFRDYYIGAGDKEMPFDVAPIFDAEVESIVHRKMAAEFVRLLGDKYSVCNEYIEKLVAL